jgi:hypothetical protein
MKALILAGTAAFGLLLEPAYAQQAAPPEADLPGARLAIALTNNVLIAGSSALLKCWITNNSANPLVMIKSPGEGTPEQYRFEVWLKTEGGSVHVLIPAPGDVGSRMGDGVDRGEVRSYTVPLPIAADIPPGHYKLRAKRKLIFPQGAQLVSNALDVQVKSENGKEKEGKAAH